MQTLVGDIGGTNSRFALATADALEFVGAFSNDEHAEFGTLLDAVIEKAAPSGLLDLHLAVAAPLTSDVVQLTNREWAFTPGSLAHARPIDTVHIVNDFTANALSLPRLSAKDTTLIGSALPRNDATKLVMGPGTGLGVGAMLPAGDQWWPVVSEGGHATLAAESDEEAQLIAMARKRFGHVSAERLLSGTGLLTLYQLMCEVAGETPRASSPAEVTAAAETQPGSVADRAVDLFLGWLGSVAGSLALSFGALGGVYLAGGVLPRLAHRIDGSQFRARFLAKGRFAAYLEPVATLLVTTPHCALIGLQPPVPPSVGLRRAGNGR